MPFYLVKVSGSISVAGSFWKYICCCSTQYLMYWLTQVSPHAVITTAVPTDFSESSKSMFCKLSVKVKGGVGGQPEILCYISVNFEA